MKPSILILCLFVIVSCGTKIIYTGPSINKSCLLNESIGDTIIISGIYSRCMEYQTFRTIKEDKCSDNFKMSLNWNKASNYEKYKSEFEKIQGCNQSMPIIVKGILEKEQAVKYGHLGTNDACFYVLDIIEFGAVKTQKNKR
ncbi:MAG: hypothetical protein ABJG68_16795 [Crocinitomicaceae bacterium]